MNTRVRTPVVVRRSLLDLLTTGASDGVTLISAPAGSGKTELLRSWIEEADLCDRVAWVPVARGERDAQRFWLAVIEQLRSAVGVDAFVERLTPSPEFDGDAEVARLLDELGSLDEPVVLVIDDLHELASPEALGQLELLLARRPPLLQIVLAARRDPRLGLHRLRLTGELTEIRAAQMHFTLEETRELLLAAGITLADQSIELLHTRTEGWAAGLRLAALSLSNHPDPERFVAEFSGSERTVADYLLAEVLERQPEDVRRLLLRTSILDRLTGPLADLLTGASGSERLLHALEDENAFVVALDVARTWFRYHALFADLLRLELRRTEPDIVDDLHRTAAAWYAEHGYIVDGVRHAQAGENWRLALGLLAEHSFTLWLRGEGATLGVLTAAFPADMRSDPELALLTMSEPLRRGALDDAAAHVALAEQQASGVPEERRRVFEVTVASARLTLARYRGDFTAVTRELQALRSLLEDTETASAVTLRSGVGAAALLNLGVAEVWSSRSDEAERHLEEGLNLARRIEAPWLEVSYLAYLALADAHHSFAIARERCLEAIALAKANGWTSQYVAALAPAALANLETWQGRLDEAWQWLGHAGTALRPGPELATGVLHHLTQGMLYLAEGRAVGALDEFNTAERYGIQLAAPNALTIHTRGFLVQTHVRLGDAAAARAALAEVSDGDCGEYRIALASLHLAKGAAEEAVDVLAPVLDGSIPTFSESLVQAFAFDAVARDLLGDTPATEVDIERALAAAEPNGLIFPFVVTPVRELLERHPRHRTAHGGLLKSILAVLAGSTIAVRAAEAGPLRDELSDSELRVLRYLSSNLSAPDIGRELYLSINTVKTHMRHIYAKLGVHRRTEAVERARELGLLAPSARRH